MWRKALPVAFLFGAALLAAPLPAAAQVAQLNAWANVHSSAPANISGTVTSAAFTVSAGTQRILVVAAVMELSANATMTTLSATYGGVAMTPIGTTAALSGREHAAAWYLLNAQIPGGAQTAAVTYTASTGTVTGIHIDWSSFTGVDQTTPINGSSANLSAAANVTFGAVVNYVLNGLTFYAAGNGGTPATETPPAGFTQRLTTTTSAHTSFTADSGLHAAAGSYAAGTTITFGGTTSARSAVVVGSLRPGPTTTTTLGNGAAGTNATVCPGAAGQKLDGFSFVNSAGTNPVTALTVTTTGFAALASLQIWDEAGTTQYFTTVNNPGSNTWNFSGGTSIPVNTTVANFKVLATYQGQATAPAGNTATTAFVSAFTTVNGTAGTDAADTTLTLDNAPPAAPTAPTCTGFSASQINLTWTNPGADFAGALVVRGPAGGAAPTFVPAEGTVYAVGAQGADYIVAVGNVASASDTGLASGTTYAYRIYAYDACANYSTALATSCATAALPGTTTQAPSATVNSCTQITVSAPFSGDANANGNTTFERGPSATGPWTAVCSAAVGASPRSCVASGLTQTTAYYFRVTFADADGVTGTNPQVIGPFTTLDCRVAPDVPTATVNSCTQIVISAPYGGDTNANSTTTFSRGPSATGPWTAVCSGVAGASPRACTDNGVTASTSYYYQVTFADADGVTGTNPQVIGPFTTPVCLVNPTTAGTAGAVVSGCREITVTAPFTGDDNNNGSVLVEYNTTATWPGTTACAAVNGPSPRMCYITGLAPGTTYYVRVTYGDPDGVAGTAVQQLPGTYATPACGADQDPPVLTILAPAENALVSGADVFKVQVYDQGGLVAVNPVQWSLDGAALGAAGVSINVNYACGAGCAVYEIAVPAQAAGSHYITVEATDLAGNRGRVSWGFRAKAAGAGTGRILRRTEGSELCLDCHNLQTHNAQYTTTKYGNWAVDCLTCHTPHQTTNLYLVRPSILTPNSGTKSPVFQVDDRTGRANPANSYLGPSTAVYDDGVCEACHTKTTHYRNTLAGSDHTHNQNSRCVDCHEHAKGFGARESVGCAGGLTPTEARCSNCHGNIWVGITNAAKVSKHLVGGTAGTNDACSDSGITWVNTYTAGTATFTLGSATVTGTGTAWSAATHVGWTMKNNATGIAYVVTAVASATSLTVNRVYMEPAAAGVAYTLSSPLSANGSAVRSCTNMCHDDHVHNNPGTPASTHEYNVYKDANTGTTRAEARAADGTATLPLPGGSQGVATTDFDNTSATGGMCLSCHRTSVDAAHPGLDQASYNLAAHNRTTTTPGGNWTYTQHDGGLFARNCTKCHTDGADTRPNDGDTPFGAVHYSDFPSLLNGTTNPNGNAANNFVCYNCHGNGTEGTNYSNKDIATQANKASRHPVDADNVHSTFAEMNNAAFGNTLGAAARHVNCLDCHTPHEAKAGTHATPGNLAGPPLEGAWGAQLSTNPAFWTNPVAGNFTKRTLVAGTDVEATLCFKCHTSFYGALPAAPSWSPNTWAETDVAKEFNPNNVGNFAGTWVNGETAGSFHPVLATCGSNLGAVTLTNLVTTNFPWSTTARNLMTCSDCHESNNAADPNGPHGSTAGFILRGPNTAWNNTIVNANTMPATVFCANCHPTSWANSRFNQHSRADHYIPCFNCHSAIPHGSPRPGFLNNMAPTAASANVGGNIAGYDNAAPYAQPGAGNRLYLASYPVNNTTQWAQANCGCNGTGH